MATPYMNGVPWDEEAGLQFRALATLERDFVFQRRPVPIRDAPTIVVSTVGVDRDGEEVGFTSSVAVVETRLEMLVGDGKMDPIDEERHEELTRRLREAVARAVDERLKEITLFGRQM